MCRPGRVLGRCPLHGQAHWHHGPRHTLDRGYHPLPGEEQHTGWPGGAHEPASGPAPGHHDGGRRAEAHQAAWPLRDEPQPPGLPHHGRLRLPCRARQPRGHGVQVLPQPPGAGGAPAHPAGALGLLRGAVTCDDRAPPHHRRHLRLRHRLPPVPPGGAGLDVLQHLPDAHLRLVSLCPRLVAARKSWQEAARPAWAGGLRSPASSSPSWPDAGDLRRARLVTGGMSGSTGAPAPQAARALRGDCPASPLHRRKQVRTRPAESRSCIITRLSSSWPHSPGHSTTSCPWPSRAALSQGAPLDSGLGKKRVSWSTKFGGSRTPCPMSATREGCCRHAGSARSCRAASCRPCFLGLSTTGPFSPGTAANP